MPRRNRKAIAWQPLTLIKQPPMPTKPPRMRSRRKETQKRNRNVTRAAAANSDQQLQQAVLDREELRAKLLQQFNAILSTRDTARGLVVNLSDVLFDTGKYTLRPLAREKLAKISGIVLAYPDLRLAIEGNTDSVGSDAMNQTLSEKRASAVLDYLGQAKHTGGVDDLARFWQEPACRLQRHRGRTPTEPPRRTDRVRRCDRNHRRTGISVPADECTPINAAQRPKRPR